MRPFSSHVRPFQFRVVQCQERSHKSQPCHQIILIHQRGNPQTTRNLGRIPHTKVPLSTFHWLPIQTHNRPSKHPPPASTVRSHDFPGTDGGVVLRMRRCGLGVRPGDKPEGPAAAVAVPGCTLAYQKMMVWKMHLISNMASLGIYV